MTDYNKIISKLEPQKIYGYRELLLIISPQTSTASYILMDLIAGGIIEETADRGYRLKQ